MRPYPASPSVLIVDDNEQFRRTAGDALRQAGYRVSEAENGLAAIRHLHRAEPPHLILLDLLMPVMDGWQLRDRLNADPELSRIPVVVTTAVGKDYQRENLLGAIAYLPKPCAAHTAVELVGEHCPLPSSGEGLDLPNEQPAGAA